MIVQPSSPSSGLIWKVLCEAGFPTLTPVAELSVASGISMHPAYQWRGIWLKDSLPLLTSDTLWPWFWRQDERYAASLPPVEFGSHVWHDDDARGNITVTVNMLSQALGPANIQTRYNTLEATWQDGASSVRALAFLPRPELERLNNPSHDREPRLRTACHVSVNTGFLPSLTQEEIHAAANVQLHIAFGGHLPSVMSESPPINTLEFSRHLTPSLERVPEGISVSADRRFLFYRGRHAYVLPMSAVRSIEVARMRPAKGPGGAWLEIKIAATENGVPTKRLTVAEASDPDGLNELAGKIADALGKPMNLQPYDYDY